MKTVHILQTDKPSRLAYDFDKLILNSRLLSPILYKNQNIYITSDEEIKEGDWAMSLCDDESYEEIYQCKKINLVDIEDKKIILTTDQDLIKDGVQAIDDAFLEWFVKNPSCEEIEVESDYRVKSGTIQEHNEGKAGYEYYDYKIIIPKEEPKQDAFNYSLNAFKVPKEYFGKDEPKQETLEEATNNYVNYCAANISENEDLADADKRGFIYGAKWQQERSYSEEEVLNIIQLFNDDFNMIHDTIPKWFEQFKKK